MTGARPVPNGRPGAQRRPGYPAKKSGFRMRPIDMIITGVAVLVIGFIIWAVWNSAQGGTAGTTDPNAVDANALKNGVQAPDFTLPGNDGNTYSLSQFKGKPVLLEFMAPWCPHCQDDAPILNQVYTKYHDKGLVMIGINASPFGHNYETGDKSPITMDDQKWFATTFKLQYPLLFDKPITQSDGTPDTALRPQYGVDYFPTLYVVDKDGKIAAHMLAEANNPISLDRISGEVDKVLK
jgi:peroxiredoxin